MRKANRLESGRERRDVHGLGAGPAKGLECSATSPLLQSCRFPGLASFHLFHTFHRENSEIEAMHRRDGIRDLFPSLMMRKPHRL
jgi:hypothetical protein